MNCWMEGKKNLGAYSLILHISEQGACENSKMRIKTKWQVHKHLTNKSHPQVKQCKQLVKMKPTLGHELALDSLHSHDMDL